MDHPNDPTRHDCWYAHPDRHGGNRLSAADVQRANERRRVIRSIIARADVYASLDGYTRTRTDVLSDRHHGDVYAGADCDADAGAIPQRQHSDGDRHTDDAAAG
jgi:hypothetical protein